MPLIVDPRFVPGGDRYERMPYRRCGMSGLMLPAISLGAWRNLGNTMAYADVRAIYRLAFERGVTHFDFANNYGLPFGSAELNFGRVLKEDLRPHRDELIITTKAGWDMWPGPYGNWGSRKHLLASLDQSLSRLGVEYVDIYYSHRADRNTPLEETMGALSSAVKQGKALYVGISSYPADLAAEAIPILRNLGTPLLVHQPSYSMLNRWIEPDLLRILVDNGVGCVAFSVVAQGMLTDKYLGGVPDQSRAAEKRSLFPEWLNQDNLDKIGALNEIAKRRGQTLPQMAIAWGLRREEISSVLIGVKRIEQLELNLRALDNLDFSEEELAEIDRYATESGINLWAEQPGT
jgi:L-glyceraldehyde 3-phosphate reductase